MNDVCFPINIVLNTLSDCIQARRARHLVKKCLSDGFLWRKKEHFGIKSCKIQSVGLKIFAIKNTLKHSLNFSVVIYISGFCLILDNKTYFTANVTLSGQRRLLLSQFLSLRDATRVICLPFHIVTT